MNYSINININGFENTDIADSRLDDVKESVIVVVLDSRSDSKLYEYYSTIKNMIVNHNRVILILDGNTSKIRKQICMLMVSYNAYDIYRLEDMSLANEEWLAEILKRNPGREEVETFIDSDIVLSNEINNLLSKFTSLVKEQKFSELNELMVNNINLLEGTVSVVDYLKNVADASSTGFKTTVEKLKSDLESKEAKIHQDELDLNDKMFTISKLKNNIEEQKAELNKYKSAVDAVSLSEGSKVLAYSTINTNTCTSRVGAILYFKEIGKLRYINTFIMTLLDVLQKMKKVKAKLLIYDHNTNFGVYKPLTSVTARNYNEQKDNYLKADSNPLVIVEPVSYILSDMIKSNCDVLIVYDRLREMDDLITGSIVYKYIVVSSMKEFEAVKENLHNFPNENIIGHPGIENNIIGIPDLNRAELRKTKAVITQQYCNMVNPCRPTEQIISKMLTDINIDSFRK